MANIPLSGVISYAASKAWASYFGVGLGPEHKGRIDVLTYEPGEVATKMIKKDKADATTIMPNTAIDVCFRDIGI